MANNFNEIPSPPNGQKGWPWEVTTSSSIADNKNFPKITVITPSFNQGEFLEETIRSVLLQQYSNLEYFVIDGGSTDNSIEIIRKYERWITWWVSEPDRGQAHAINKGFERCTGDLVGWINSDDMLLPGSLMDLGMAYVKTPGSLLLGNVVDFSSDNGKTRIVRQKKVSGFRMVYPEVFGVTWHQPGVFVPSNLIKGGEFLDVTLRYLFDQDWMCRLLRKADVKYLNKSLAMFRRHPHSKTVGENTLWLPEIEAVIHRYWDEIPRENQNEVLAFFEIQKAAVQLGAKNWNRQSGVSHLQKAFSIDKRVLFKPIFFNLLLRCLLPRRFLMWLRAKILK